MKRNISTKKDEKPAPRGTLKRADEYVQGILHGDRILLSQAITLVESQRSEHQALAKEILEKCLPATGNSLRIGISGPPGVGKSTFIESFGTFLIQSGKKLAVLAIDPSSQVSKGSILGDKTRMGRLSSEKNAFIRPSPTGGSLGGVADSTRETILLCEAAGFDTILVETVGVGQSEVLVHEMVDFLLLLLQPGSGDELQGIKRGIIEKADLLVVNKADGENKAAAKNTRTEYASALHYFPAKQNGWKVKTLTCSALTGEGMEQIWQAAQSFHQLALGNGWLQKNRQGQFKSWLYGRIERGLKKAFFEDENVKHNLQRIEEQVVSGNTLPTAGAEDLIALFKKAGPSKLPPL